MSGRYIAVDRDVLTTPRDGEVAADRWWIVDDDGRPLVWKRNGSRGYSPQCNRDRRVVDRMTHDGHRAEFIEVAYLGPWDEHWGYTMPWLEDNQ